MTQHIKKDNENDNVMRGNLVFLPIWVVAQENYGVEKVITCFMSAYGLLPSGMIVNKRFNNLNSTNFCSEVLVW